MGQNMTDTESRGVGLLRLSQLRRILEMIRFSHTIFALPFALLAALLAWQTPAPSSYSGVPVSFGWRSLVGIVLCMVTARNASMAFNRIVDRKIDAQNPRTASRHLAAGTLSLRSVTIFLIGNVLGFIASTALFLPNRWPLILAVPVLGILMSYSYTKRFTSLAHFWLGLALMLAPICTWIAIRGVHLSETPGDLLPATFIGFAVLLWVAGFDIIYACQDHAFDVKARLRSIPVRLGIQGALRLSALCHAMMVGTLAALPIFCPQINLGIIYWVGIAVVAMLLLYEHILVRPDDLRRVNMAFFQVNAIISLGLLLIVAADIYF